jgi:hypothetical protein
MGIFFKQNNKILSAPELRPGKQTHRSTYRQGKWGEVLGTEGHNKQAVFLYSLVYNSLASDKNYTGCIKISK